MKDTIESKIRLNVILIYVLVALVCGSLFFYFYSSINKVTSQKITVEEYNKELLYVNNLIYEINSSQAQANLFIATKKSKYLKEYRTQITDIEFQIDSLKTNVFSISADSILNEISFLLKEKEKAIVALNKQINSKNPIDSFSYKLRSQITEYEETVSPVVVESDTLIQQSKKRNFWQRLSNVVSPEDSKDTVITIKQTTANLSALGDSLPMKTVVDEVKQGFDKKISSIENQINLLVIADQDISSGISNLLIQLYSKIVDSRLDEIEREEELLKRNNLWVLIGGGVALFLIFIFIVLILQNVNKGYINRKALEKINSQNKQLMESRHKLLLSVSHDVKTPLSSIMGYLELHKEGTDLRGKEIKSMQNSGKHILALLNNLLQFSSLEQGTLQVNSQPFSLDELCDELYEMFAPLAANKNLSFTRKKDFEPHVILHSDILKVKQILINILSNAIKYTVEGSIEFETTYNEGNLKFRIVDSGVGIPTDKINTLFKPFSRVSENNLLAEGSGLGLYVMKGLVDLLEGEIFFDTKENKGTLVTVKMKIREEQRKADAPSPKKLLVIDDDKLFLSVVTQLCQQLGHTAIACTDEEEFSKQLHHADGVDFVLTDMEMGSFSGVDVLSGVQRSGKNIPVILMTGRADYSPDKARGEGFYGHLEKPVSIDSIQSLIGGTIQDVRNEQAPGEEYGELSPEIKDLFTYSTIDNIIMLRETVATDDFNNARNICHKMLPMLILNKAPEEIILVLKEIDSLRSADDVSDYQWKDNITRLTDQLEVFLQNFHDSAD